MTASRFLLNSPHCLQPEHRAGLTTYMFIVRPALCPGCKQCGLFNEHHNTVKYLIGITPQGSIAYISNGWGGKASDVFITENSGLLCKLLPGDVILADRGFMIRESAGLYCAEVKLPPFTKWKRQLNRVEVDAAWRLSSVCIHVERVIGLVWQKYTILQSTLPINLIACCKGKSVSVFGIVMQEVYIN